MIGSLAEFVKVEPMENQLGRRVILYIDGFNLYFGLRESGQRRLYWYDPVGLGHRLLKPGQSLVRVHLFTSRISPVPSDPGKHRRQAAWLEATALDPLLQQHFGHDLPKAQTCFQCGYQWTYHEEKMSDVRLVVQMMQDAHDGAVEVQLVLSADSDLAPPMEAIRSRHPGVRMVAVFPPGRHSKKLESVAHAAYTLGKGVLRNGQLPDQIQKPDGFVLQRPASWR